MKRDKYIQNEQSKDFKYSSQTSFKLGIFESANDNIPSL